MMLFFFYGRRLFYINGNTKNGVYWSSSSIVTILKMLSKEPCYFSKTTCIVQIYLWSSQRSLHYKLRPDLGTSAVKVIHFPLRLHMYDKLDAPVQCFPNMYNLYSCYGRQNITTLIPVKTNARKYANWSTCWVSLWHLYQH